MSGARILQATAWYPPYGMGGTETYVEGLVAELARRGTTSQIIVPRSDGAPPNYNHGPAPVSTYPVEAAACPKELRGQRAHGGFDEFEMALEAAKPSIYHQHSWTRGCGIHHLRAAKKRGLKTIVTVHVPGAICLNGTMIRNGTDQCDGKIYVGRCGSCWLRARGMPAAAAAIIGHAPLVLSRAALNMPRAGGATTAIGAAALAANTRSLLDQMVENADRIIAVCQWLYDGLLLNGVPEEKLVLNRQGVDVEFAAAAHEASIKAGASKDQSLRLVYFGRLNPVKGVDVVARAISALPPETKVTLDIFGVASGEDDFAERRIVEALAARDTRIRLKEPVSRARLAETLASYDAAAVPSLWLETGPLVVLEAQVAGLFVIGADRGGIRELVHDDRDGALVSAGDVDAWAQAIASLVDRKAVEGLERPISRVRSMGDVADEMIDLYAQVENA